jgi:hypothetical protein
VGDSIKRHGIPRNSTGDLRARNVRGTGIGKDTGTTGKGKSKGVDHSTQALLIVQGADPPNNLHSCGGSNTVA